MMVKGKQVEQMYLTWRESEVTQGWEKRRYQYSQNGEGRHTWPASRSHNIGEQGCWVVQGCWAVQEESKPLGQ